MVKQRRQKSGKEEEITTITVKKSTKRRLDILKMAYNKKSMDDLINCMGDEKPPRSAMKKLKDMFETV